MARRNAIFALVSAAMFIDMMMYTLVVPILPIYSKSLGADQFTVGVIFGVFSVALLLCGIPLGMLSDRIGRRPLMVAGMFLMGLATIVFTFSGSLYMLILARIVQGISGAATWSAGLALIADTFDASERGSRLGMAIAIMAAGTTTGPVVGGLVYDHLGYRMAFVLPAMLAIGMCATFLAITVPPRLQSAKSDYGKVLGKAPLALVTCSVATVVGAMTYGVMEPFMPLFLVQKFSAALTASTMSTTIGLAFAAMSLLNMVAAPIMGKLYDRFGGRALLASGLILSGLIFAATMAMPAMWSTILVFSLLGITMSMGLTPMLPLLTDLFGGSENGSGGFIYGIYNTLFSAGLAIGSLIGGMLVTRLDFPATVLIQAVLLALTGVAFFAVVRDRASAVHK